MMGGRSLHLEDGSLLLSQIEEKSGVLESMPGLRESLPLSIKARPTSEHLPKAEELRELTADYLTSQKLS